MISPSSSTASSQPATSPNVVFGMSLVISFASRLGELHDAAAAAALHLVHQEEEEQHDQDERQQGRDDLADQAGVADADVVGVGIQRLVLDVLLDRGLELGLRAVEPVRGDVGAGRTDAVLERRLDGLVATVGEGDRLDLPVVDVLLHLAGLDLVVSAR